MIVSLHSDFNIDSGYTVGDLGSEKLSVRATLSSDFATALRV